MSSDIEKLYDVVIEGRGENDAVLKISKQNPQKSNKKRWQRERNDRYEKIHSQKKSKVSEAATDSTCLGSMARYQRKRRLEMKEQGEIKQDQVEGSKESINHGRKTIRKETSNNRYLKKKRMEEKRRKS